MEAVPVLLQRQEGQEGQEAQGVQEVQEVRVRTLSERVQEAQQGSITC